MGRLFWKFFFFFWLAQFLTSLGVGIAIWAHRPLHPDANRRPVPPQMERAAGLGMGPEMGRDMGSDMERNVGPAGERNPPPDGRDRPPPSWLDDRLRPPPDDGWFRRLIEPSHPRSPLPPLMPILAGSVVSVIFAALLAWYFSRPIRTLRGAFEAVAAGKLETRIGPAMGTRRDELADLGGEFDHMAERLQGLIEGQRRLLHDVSHELRSPLARLQAAADLMRQQPERATEFFNRIERDTVRMDRLVGELLTLARLDAGMVGTPREILDLGELVAEIADDAQLEAEARHCRIELAQDAGLTVSGNSDLLRRAVENVLRNALRHTPPGTTVAITTRGDAAQVRIIIADAGPGVPAADLDAIFEPFYRAANTDPFTGHGLGLAITRRVVQLHGGTVSAANQPAGGFVVALSLPPA
jgi:signal transduction histidine kinase